MSDPNLREVRMHLYTETIELIEKLQQKLEKTNRTDTVAACAHLMAEVLERLDAGATIEVIYPDGKEEELRIHDSNDAEIKPPAEAWTLLSVPQTPDNKAN